MASSINAVVAAVQDQMQAVTGIGKVEDRPGGVAFWAASPGLNRNYWEIDLAPAAAIAETEIGLGGFNRRRYMVVLSGWLPLSYQNPNSHTAWRDLVDALCTRIRLWKTLGLAGAINDVGNPQVTRWDYQVVSPGNLPNQRTTAPEVECHHAELSFYVEELIRYQAQ